MEPLDSSTLRGQSRPSRQAHQSRSLSPDLEEQLATIASTPLNLGDDRPEQIRLKLLIYLIPVVGFPLALWVLSHSPKSPSPQGRIPRVLRLAVASGSVWSLGMMLTAGGLMTADGPPLLPLVTASLLTSSYFVINVWLMIQVLRRQRLQLPGLSPLSDRLP